MHINIKVALENSKPILFYPYIFQALLALFNDLLFYCKIQKFWSD